MNRRFYCAVGVASGVFLLGGGVAQAGASALEAGGDRDPLATRGLPTDIFTPTRGQYRLATPIDTPTERTGNKTPNRGPAEIRPNTQSPSHEGTAGTATSSGSQAGRTEGLIPGLGGSGAGPLLGLLSGLPGGTLLGGLTSEASPLGQLLGDGPLGALLGGGKKTPANDAGASGTSGTSGPAGASGAANANWPKNQSPATGADGATNDWHQARPAATGPVTADPALSGAPANPAWRPAAPSSPATHRMDDAAAATRGNTVGEDPMGSANNSGSGLTERKSAADGNPLAGGVLGPNSPLSRVELLGGDTLAGLPLVGDLLAGGLNLNTLNNLPGLNDLVKRIGAKDADKTSLSSGNLQTVGKLGRMLLSGESTTAATESTGTHRAIDKTKVTPELLPLFGPDAPGGMIHQLPPVG